MNLTTDTLDHHDHSSLDVPLCSSEVECQIGQTGSQSWYRVLYSLLDIPAKLSDSEFHTRAFLHLYLPVPRYLSNPVHLHNLTVPSPPYLNTVSQSRVLLHTDTETKSTVPGMLLETQKAFIEFMH